MTRDMSNWVVDLPEPLMAIVLKGLPFSSLLALRLVSKTWGRIIRAHASMFCPDPAVRHFLLASNGKDYACYSPQKDKWFQGSPFPAEVSTRHYQLRASAGGLLLFAAGGLFIVLNPLTKSYKKLPDIPGRGRKMITSAMGISYHAPFRSYLVIVAENDMECNGSAITAVYNSLAGSWTVSAGIKGKCFSSPFQHFVYSNGSFFATVYNSGSPVQHEHSLVRYRVQQQTWSEDEATLPCTGYPYIGEIYLGEIDGQILLALKVEETRRVAVWALSPAKGKWNLVYSKGVSLIRYSSLVKTILAGKVQYWKTNDYPSLLIHNLQWHAYVWDSVPELPNCFGLAGSYVAFEPSLIAAP